MKPKLASFRKASANTPLRIQLVAVVLVLLIFALAAVSLTATSSLRSFLVERADQQLTGTARDQGRQGQFQRTLSDQERAQMDRQQEEQARTGAGPQRPALLSGFYTETVDANGNGTGQLSLAEGKAQSAPNLPLLDSAAVTKLDGRPFTAGSKTGDSQWRVLVTAKADGTGAYVAAINLSDVNDTVSKFKTTLIIVSAITLIVGIALAYLLVRQRLKKLIAVEHTAERIAAGDLSQRVPAASERTEVGRLAAALNTMLVQIEEAFEAQQASEAEARESESRMRRFVADASHELRTPLTSIRGFAELQRQNAAAGIEPPPHAIARIESEARRMSMLVEDLLTLARLDQQRSLDLAPVDLYDIVIDTVRDAVAAAPSRTVQMLIDDDKREFPFVVVGDEMRLRQVLANITSNAYVHTPDGSPIELALREDGTNAYVDIIDHGPGMSEEDAARIFERFYRSDNSRTRTSGGTGLGLSIVAGLIEAHGGTVSVRTAPGEGAVFTVQLPLAQAAD